MLGSRFSDFLFVRVRVARACPIYISPEREFSDAVPAILRTPECQMRGIRPDIRMSSVLQNPAEVAEENGSPESTPPASVRQTTRADPVPHAGCGAGRCALCFVSDGEVEHEKFWLRCPENGFCLR